MQTYLCDTSYKRHFINDINLPAFKKKTGGFSSLKAYNNVTEANFIVEDSKKEDPPRMIYLITKICYQRELVLLKSFYPHSLLQMEIKTHFLAAPKRVVQLEDETDNAINIFCIRCTHRIGDYIHIQYKRRKQITPSL